MARELFLSIRTVECYIARIFDKLGLEQHVDEHRRVQAVLIYHRATASALPAGLERPVAAAAAS